MPGRGDEEVAPEAGAFIVTEGYFRILGIPLLDGREVDARAVAEGRPEAVVSRSFALQVWGREDGAGGRLLASQLYGVTPTDAATFAGAVAALILVALLAAALPTRGATPVDPVEAPRAE